MAYSHGNSFIIKSSISGELPKNVIKLGDIKGDLHIHTTASDGRGKVEDIVRAAKKKGYKYIAITDHSKYVRIAGGMDEKRLLAYAKKIRKLDKDIKGIKILMGVEVDILESGKLDLEDYALKEMDIVVAAVHSHFSMDRRKQTDRILRAIDNKYVNILAHPSGRLITSRRGLQIDFEKVFLKAVENNIFLEINTHGERIDLNDINARRAKEIGAKFVINTDSHEIEQLDEIKYGVITARRAALRKKDVLNTYSFDKMIKALKKA